MKEKMINKFALACADAYVNQYVLDNPVMNNPVVIYDKTDDRFFYQSSLTPIAEDQIVVLEIEEGIWGEEIDAAPGQARKEIQTYITEYMDKSELFEILRGVEKRKNE